MDENKIVWRLSLFLIAMVACFATATFAAAETDTVTVYGSVMKSEDSPVYSIQEIERYYEGETEPSMEGLYVRCLDGHSNADFNDPEIHDAVVHDIMLDMEFSQMKFMLGRYDEAALSTIVTDQGEKRGDRKAFKIWATALDGEEPANVVSYHDSYTLRYIPGGVRMIMVQPENFENNCVLFAGDLIDFYVEQGNAYPEHRSPTESGGYLSFHFKDSIRKWGSFDQAEAGFIPTEMIKSRELVWMADY